MALLRGCSAAGRRLLWAGLCPGSGETLCRAGTRALSKASKDREPLRKPNTPQGRFDKPEEEKSSDVLQKFPDDVNPVTKERGGPRGPEPTRYGDWERKGRCVDF